MNLDEPRAKWEARPLPEPDTPEYAYLLERARRHQSGSFRLPDGTLLRLD